MKDLENEDFMFVSDSDVYSISEYFCKIINRVYRLIDVKGFRGKDDYDSKLNKLFKLDINHHHNLIEASCWLIEDAELAIGDFKKYGIEGVTKLKDNTGERYMRLYGFLQSTYNQRSGYLKLCDVFQFPSWKKKRSQFRNLMIIEARNMISSHTLDYANDDGNKDFFKLVQSRLYTNSVKIVGKRNHYDLDLNIELRKFYQFLHPQYVELLEHIHIRYFKNNDHNNENMKKSIDVLKSKIATYEMVLPYIGKGVIDLRPDQDK